MAVSFQVNATGDAVDLKVQGSTIASFAIDGASLQGNVINRTTSSSDLLLSRLNQVHRYTGTGNVIDIPTLIEENAVYEMHVNFDSDTSANRNVDPYLLPNSYADAANYAGEFQYTFIARCSNTNDTVFPPPDVTVAAASSTSTNDTHTPALRGFYCDNFLGVAGVNGTLIMRLDNRRRNKTVMFQTGDSSGIAVGHSCWTNDTRVWSRVGALRLYAGTVDMGVPGWYAQIDGAADPAAISWVLNIRRIY